MAASVPLLPWIPPLLSMIVALYYQSKRKNNRNIWLYIQVLNTLRNALRTKSKCFVSPCITHPITIIASTFCVCSIFFFINKLKLPEHSTNNMFCWDFIIKKSCFIRCTNLLLFLHSICTTTQSENLSLLATFCHRPINFINRCHIHILFNNLIQKDWQLHLLKLLLINVIANLNLLFFYWDKPIKHQLKLLLAPIENFL
jgi:hypothetical protein